MRNGTKYSIGLAFIAIVAVFSTSCGGGLGGMGGGGGGLSGQCSADFGASAAARKLGAFVDATNAFTTAANDIAGGLTNACKDMGRELGLSDADMAASGDTPEVKAACDAVAAKIRSELQDLRASASLTISVVAQPPVCEVSMSATADCYAECEVDVDPGEVNVQCEGGEIRGGCSGECSGSCSVEANAECSGKCEGTCSAGCTGTCQGTCDGTCSATGADGQCNGRCQGECQGTCSAGCQGSCSGSCVVEAQASCQGECRGECSVEFTEPRCTGEVRPPSASADCQASCSAKLEAQAECRPGHVAVNIEGNVAENVSERVGRLRNAFESGFPAIMALKAKVERLGAAGRAVVDTGSRLPDAVGELGLNAVGCATSAVGALGEATASVSVSVEVSASVSASAG
jgi:hypothetical protein